MLSNEEREQSHGSPAVRYHPQDRKHQQQSWGLGLAEVGGEELKLTERKTDSATGWRAEDTGGKPF